MRTRLLFLVLLALLTINSCTTVDKLEDDIIVGIDGEDGEDGQDGQDGTNGEDGDDGVSCWDLNQNGTEDPEEDTNGDGAVDIQDCRYNESQCSDVYDTWHCSNRIQYIFWLKDKYNQVEHYSVSSITHFVEKEDGTAILCGKVQGNASGEVLNIDVKFTGRTDYNDNPKDHICEDPDKSTWYYYEDFSGTLVEVNGDFVVEIAYKKNGKPRGEMFQVGNGANVTERDINRRSASGWFWVVGGDSDFKNGDINIVLECK